MSGRARPTDTPSERSFADRLSPLIAAFGVIAVPTLLLRYQRRLQLTSNEIVYLQHVLMHRWENAWPWVAISEIVDATGAADRSVRDWKASLVAKELLTVRTRGREGGGRGADEHDLSKLFAALEALAVEDEMQRATDQARKQLPSPTYYDGGLGAVPQFSGRQQRRLQTERVKPHQTKAAENRRIEAAENRRSLRPESAAIKRPEPASEVEAVSKSPLQEATHVEKTGLAAAGRLPGHEPGNGTGRPIEQATESNADKPAPGYWDDGISYYLGQWSVEFVDDDAPRSLDRTHHLWWNSKLPRWRFHNAMKAAYYETRSRTGKINGPPMAYFLAVLRTTASEQCLREGLTPLSETREEQRERMALGGMPIEDLELAARLDGLKSEDQVQRRPGRRRRERAAAVA